MIFTHSPTQDFSREPVTQFVMVQFAMEYYVFMYRYIVEVFYIVRLILLT